MDYFHAVGELGLGSRLKRLSDTFMNDVKAIYSSEDIDFEPKWFPLFSLLIQRKEVTITSAAQQLKLTHPHISQLAKEMTEAKIAAFRLNPADARSRTLTLSPRGEELGRRLLPLWSDIRVAVYEIVQEADPRFLENIGKMEAALERSPLSERAKKNIQIRAKDRCRILDFKPELKKYFESLNREWLERYFSVEPADLRFFSNPEKEILKKGGEIFFAELDGKVLGTCTLIQEEKNLFELARLAVTESARGKGIGELLTREAITRAKQRGARKIRLFTNSSLIPAVRLYEKLGFKETYRGQHPKYLRTNLIMERSV